MIKFLLKRPIAVLMSFLALVILSVIASTQLPISLLPPIEAPTIIIKINYPNGSPEEIEQNILRPIRENMLTINHLKDIESKASSETGLLELTFDYKAAMNLAYIEVNEKLDYLIDQLPRDLERPQVARVNTSDLPIAKVQIIPKDSTQMLSVSEFSRKVIKKRLEQLKGVSLVDMNGLKIPIIVIVPNSKKVQALGISNESLITAIRQHNIELGAISVKDGQYRYYVKLLSKLSKIADLEDISVMTRSGMSVSLKELAGIQKTTKKIQGFHFYNFQEALVINVHKQASSKMTELMPLLYGTVKQFKKDYPDIDFVITQNQSLLLNSSISNLRTSLLYGGIFAFIVLFFFIGNYRIPLIMGVSLPVSLMLSFLVFYFFNLSINIISLSGLALGLGMLVDNAIIVLDNISRKHNSGLDVIESCSTGVKEVMAPLISSTLTTLAVFIPLIFLSGLAGALFFDQAIAVASILSISLVVAFFLLPLLYQFFVKNKYEIVKKEPLIFEKIKNVYLFFFDRIFRNKKLSLVLLLFIIPISLLTFFLLEKEGMPPIEKQDRLLEISWNEPVDVYENKRRVRNLLIKYQKDIKQSEGDIGMRQFLLEQKDNTTQRASIYLLFENKKNKDETLAAIARDFQNKFPTATYRTKDAPNTFDQIFNSDKPFFEIRLKNFNSSKPIDTALIFPFLDSLKQTLPTLKHGDGLMQETIIKLSIDYDKLRLYGIDHSYFINKLEQLLGEYNITDIKNFGEVTPVILKENKSDLLSSNSEVFVKSNTGILFPLNQFINYQFATDYKNITADRSGIYHSVTMSSVPENQVLNKLSGDAKKSFLTVSFFGEHYTTKKNFWQLLSILGISVLLLYFILAAQFESITQPFIVLLTLPLGIGGSLLFLLLSGSSLNIMSSIGIVVMLGIMVNDAILKIDAINNSMQAIGKDISVFDYNKQLLNEIHQTGLRRLKPILMTSITTILALLPILFSSGIGADLQSPLVWSVIGGLTVGTFTAIYLVPLMYWFLNKKRESKSLSL